MQIVLIGLNQRTAPLALRERAAVGPDALPAVLTALRAHADEALVLSTCNRVELYALAGHHESGTEMLTRVLAATRRLDAATIRRSSYARSHEDAVRHLHRVAAGLDSLVVGEAEVLTQVRRAAARARAAGALGTVLGRLAASAVSHGRRARADAGGTHAAPSVASLALREAERVGGPLRDKTVVVLGAGDTAARACAHVAAQRPARLVVVNRTRARAVALAARHGAEVCAWGDRHHAAASADLFVACASSPEPVLEAHALRRSRTSATRRLLCVDLSVPRVVEPAVADVPGVTLLDLGAIETLAPRLAPVPSDAIAHAERAVELGVERFMAWWRARAVVPTVAALREHADAVRDAELARALARLPRLSAREQRVVVGLARRIVSKLMHEPTMALKEDPEGANIAVIVRRLFALESTGDSASRDSAPREDASHEHAPHADTIPEHVSAHTALVPGLSPATASHLEEATSR